MEWPLWAGCILLWMVYSALKECISQLKIMNGNVQELQGRVVDQGERLENRVFDLNEKLSSIQETTDEYYKEFIKPLKGHY